MHSSIYSANIYLNLILNTIYIHLYFSNKQLTAHTTHVGYSKDTRTVQYYSTRRGEGYTQRGEREETVPLSPTETQRGGREVGVSKLTLLLQCTLRTQITNSNNI